MGLVLSYVKLFLNMVTGLFMSSFLISRLGDTEYGVYQTISSFANYLVLLEFGTGTIMTRNLSACRAKGGTKSEIEKNISTVWGITSALAAAIVLVAIGFYFSIGGIYAGSMTLSQIASAKRMFVFIVIFLLSSFCTQTLNGIIIAFDNYTYSSAVNIIKIVLRTAIVAALVWRNGKAVAITVVDAALTLILLIIEFFYCNKKLDVKITLRHFDKLIFKTSLPLCLAMFLQSITNQAGSTVGKFVLGVMTSPENVSLYSVGLYIYSIFSSITIVPLTMYAPQIIRDVAAGVRDKELTEKLVAPCRLTVIVGGTVMFGFIAAGKPFVSIVYGEKYLSAWLLAVILMLPTFVNVSNSVIINVLDAMNKRLVRSVILIITTVLNILMTIVFIKRFGIIGAAVSAALTTILQIVLNNAYYAAAVKIKVFYLFFNTYKGILIYQILGAAVGYFMGRTAPNAYLSFLLGGATYIVVSLGGFLLFGINDNEKNALKKFISRLRHKND